MEWNTDTRDMPRTRLILFSAYGKTMCGRFIQEKQEWSDVHEMRDGFHITYKRDVIDGWRELPSPITK